MKIPKWVIAVLACSLVIGGGLWLNNESIRVTRSLRFFSLMSFMATDYMPAQRRLTKKWPDTLISFPQSLRTDKVSSLQEWEEFQKDDFIKIYHDFDVTLEVVQMCPYSYVYRLHSKYFSCTCKSTVKPDKGYCYFDYD